MTAPTSSRLKAASTLWSRYLIMLASAVFLSRLGQGLLTGASTNFFVDTLNMSGTSPFESDAHPKRGSTQASVESRYGKPDSTRAAVGDPPIERWVYKDFVVYFEYDRVIHTVAKR